MLLLFLQTHLHAERMHDTGGECFRIAAATDLS